MQFFTACAVLSTDSRAPSFFTTLVKVANVPELSLDFLALAIPPFTLASSVVFDTDAVNEFDSGDYGIE